MVQWATGVLTFEAQTVDPVDGRWVCEAHGDGEWTGAEEASFEIRTDEDIKWSLTATRAGATLRLEESATGDSASAPFCGSGGTISGTYFRIPSLDSSR
ncbi:hypothetical protein N8D56_09070 [Devosia sp. A8/3-2]|nr:hypothetical protein N8D56_09070 [Devosia sp. A8/3-2]